MTMENAKSAANYALTLILLAEIKFSFSLKKIILECKTMLISTQILQIS